MPDDSHRDAGAPHPLSPPPHAHAPHHARWLGWTLGVLAAPAVYVLTLPMIYKLALALSAPAADPFAAPAWVEALAGPYHWLTDHLPLMKAPLHHYFHWWVSNTPEAGM